jgi:CcmD family protein
MLYLFVGYFVLWALTFGYLFVLGTRQKQMQRDLERLLEERSPSESGAPDLGAPEFS